MRTLEGAWHVEGIRTRSGQVFRVRQRAVIGAHDGAGWAPIGKIRTTVGEVQSLLGDGFAELVEV